MKKIITTIILSTTLLLSGLGHTSTNSQSDILSELKATAVSSAANYIYSIGSAGDETVLLALLAETKKQTALQAQQLEQTKKTNEILSSIMGGGEEYPAIKH